MGDANALGIVLGSQIGIHNLYEENDYVKFKELLEEVKYDFIVMDVQNAMLQYRDFVSLLQELVIVETGESRAQWRAGKLKQMLQDQANVRVIRNRMELDEEETAGNHLEGIPLFRTYEPGQLIDRLAELEIFDTWI